MLSRYLIMIICFQRNLLSPKLLGHCLTLLSDLSLEFLHTCVKFGLVESPVFSLLAALVTGKMAVATSRPSLNCYRRSFLFRNQYMLVTDRLQLQHSKFKCLFQSCRKVHRDVHSLHPHRINSTFDTCYYVDQDTKWTLASHRYTSN